MEVLILTNNPLVRSREPGVFFVTGNAPEVLRTARDFIHRGYRLLTHPLAGGIQPGRTPYRSLLLAVSDRSPDPDSVLWIESALQFAARTPPPSGISEAALRDFQRIDDILLGECKGECR